MVSRDYNIEEWAEATVTGRSLFNAGLRMSGREFRGWKLAKVAPMEVGTGRREHAYVWQRQSSFGTDLLRVDAAELASWRDAHARLLDALDNSMRPGVPRGAGSLAACGDVLFVARDPESDMPAAVVFSRGNMFIGISSVGERNIDVSKYAHQMDRALTSTPTKRQIAAGRVRAELVDVMARERGQKLVLRENLVEFMRAGWLKVLAPDGELRREDDALIYEPASPGNKLVELYTMLAIPRQRMVFS